MRRSAGGGGDEDAATEPPPPSLSKQHRQQGMQEARYDSMCAFRFELGRLLALYCAPATALALLGRADAAIRATEEVS